MGFDSVQERRVLSLRRINAPFLVPTRRATGFSTVFAAGFFLDFFSMSNLHKLYATDFT